MAKNINDEKVFKSLAEKYGLKVSEVRKIVYSFFDILQLEARLLPFNNDTRIYTREKFNEMVSVYQIPSLGRLGPVYSRYLNWRCNEAKLVEQKKRSEFRKESLKEKAEKLAEQILSGNASSDCSFKELNRSTKHKRVWMVGTDGKKLASQVILEIPTQSDPLCPI